MDTLQNVVVIDDDAVVLSVIEDLLLEKSGFMVRAFRTFHAAFEALNTDAVDILVTDITLGGEATGVDACIVAVERHPRISLVLISAESACDYQGYPPRTVFLQKPFSADELMSSIARAQEASSVETRA